MQEVGICKLLDTRVGEGHAQERPENPQRPRLARPARDDVRTTQTPGPIRPLEEPFRPPIRPGPACRGPSVASHRTEYPRTGLELGMEKIGSWFESPAHPMKGREHRSRAAVPG